MKAIEQRLLTDTSITLFLNNAGQAAVTPLIESDVDKLELMLEVNVSRVHAARCRVCQGVCAAWTWNHHQHFLGCRAVAGHAEWRL